MISALLLTAIAALSLFIAVGPLNFMARRYVDDLQSRTGPIRSDTIGAPAGAPEEETVSIQFPQLLERWPQGCLAFVMLGLTTAWGVVTEATVDTLVALPLVAILCVACSVDAVCQRLPNTFLFWAGCWVAGTTLIRLIVELVMGVPLGAAGWPVLRALLSAIIAVVALTAMALLPSGLGLGDVKLWAVLGLWLGRFAAWAPVAALVTGFFLGGLAAVVLIVLRRVGRKDHIAFGPYLAAGAWLTWLLAVV